MIAQELARYMGIPAEEVEQLLKIGVRKLAADPGYQAMLKKLDLPLLESTMAEAHNLIEKGLPEFTDHITSEYSLRRNPMSGYTLANWLVGYLNFPEKVEALVELHDRVPHEAVEKYLPAVIQMLQPMSQGREEWQKALATVGIILVAS